MQHGRPSRSAQLEIQNNLRKYYDLGLSARTAAQKTHINIKTATKYFDEWTEQIMEQQKSDFIEIQKIERARIIASFETQISDAADSLEQINSEIYKFQQKDQAIPKYLFAYRLDTQKFISSLIERRGAFVLQLPIDEKAKSMITEMVREHVSKSIN